MSFERIHRSSSQTPQTSWSTSQFAPRPFPVQEPERPPSQEELENQTFQQNKFEPTGLQLKEKYGPIVPGEQERLGPLQAKMDSFTAQQMNRAKAQPNLLEILIHHAQSTRVTKSAAPIQPKLTIGQPNDQYEQEADHVAEQVMSIAPPATPNIQRQTEEEQEEVQTKPLVETITPIVQRQEALEEKEPIQAKCESCEKDEQVQRSPNGVPQVQADLEGRLNASKGGGNPLPDKVRSFMEPRFGADFSGVRVHTGGEAVQMNRELNAQAFTHKSDIYFGSDNSPENNDLMAHELTHVIQQTHRAKSQGKEIIAQRKVRIENVIEKGLIQLSPLSDQLKQTWTSQGKGPFFERLRHLSNTDRADPDLQAFANTLVGDDRWLSQNLLAYGAEASWPIHLRVEREMKGWGDCGGKGAVFEILRAANGGEAGNAQLTASLNRVFAIGTDDIWLAQNLQAHGREASWPIHLRVEREMKGWGDCGGVPAVFTILQTANGAEAGNAALTATLNRIFAADPDNLQVALHWQAHGRADQHADTALPDAAKQRAIAAELNPTSTGSGGAPLDWDGGTRSRLSPAAKTAARNALKNAVRTAMTRHLAGAMPGIRRTAAARRLTMTQLEGPGRAAKQVTDARFGALGSAAALTPSQAAQRSGFQFRGTGPNQTLFDAYDPAQRSAAGHPVDPADLANWISETEAASQTAQQAHHFNPHRSSEEETFLQNEILNPFVTAHRADLEQYDLFGFAISGARIVVPSSVELGLSDTPGSGGEPSPAERAARWSTWKILVHEYIHTLAHPAFNSAARGNRIMTEGFCELFTKEVLLAEIPRAPSNATICAEVEGGSFTPPPPAIVGSYNPGEYADYLQHAENIRDRVIGGTEGANAVKAAFFQGHVELLGLNSTGAPTTPSAGRNMITVPAGITTVAALAVATGVPEADILAANSGLTAASPLPAQLNLPGCRDHVVVVAEDRGGARTPETKAQIAIQNGVTIADLDRANPGMGWSGLTAGQHILIPRH